jgi:hypothetical protein
MPRLRHVAPSALCALWYSASAARKLSSASWAVAGGGGSCCEGGLWPPQLGRAPLRFWTAWG